MTFAPFQEIFSVLFAPFQEIFSVLFAPFQGVFLSHFAPFQDAVLQFYHFCSPPIQELPRGKLCGIFLKGGKSWMI